MLVNPRLNPGHDHIAISSGESLKVGIVSGQDDSSACLNCDRYAVCICKISRISARGSEDSAHHLGHLSVRYSNVNCRLSG